MAHAQMTAPTAAWPATGTAPGHRLILAFALAFAVFLIVPSFLSQQLGIYPLMKVEDVFALLTPLVLVPLYWLLLRQAAGNKVSPGAMLFLLLLSVLWVDSHGVHLAANSISHLMDETKGGPAWQLTYFYDEVQGHYLWHIGVMGLAVLLVAVEWRSHAAGSPGALFIPAIAGFVYGLTFFMMVIEGQTAPLGVPFALLFALAGLVWGRGRLTRQPLLAFFVIAHIAAALLFAIWWMMWGGLPEFSEVGIIK